MAEYSLFTADGERKYLELDERRNFFEASFNTTRKRKSICQTLYYTGCRSIELTRLRIDSIDFAAKAIIINSAKKRRQDHYRSVPVPDSLLEMLDNIYGLREKQNRSSYKNEIIWDYTTTGIYKAVTETMEKAGIRPGAHRNPKGLRHSFAIAALTCDPPVDLVTISRWMGHSSLEMTAIYCQVGGERERELINRMWN